MAARILMETERLILREMTQDDLGALCQILCDADVMRAAYQSPFTPEEAQGWLNRHLKRYETLGFGLWAVVLKQTGEMIGQCGLTLQGWRDGEVLEIGYLFRKEHWHRGYATEATMACRNYAFSALHAGSVHSIVRDTNIAAQNVALRNGMKLTDRDVKNFRNTDMLFHLYTATRTDQTE